MRFSTVAVGLAAMFAAAGSLIGAAAAADDASTCANGAGDEQIVACTRSINSGQWRGHDLAWAYVDRGKAYNEKGDNVHAVADYDTAIRLDPKDAIAYNNRGNAHDDLNEYDLAIADYDEAIRLDPKYVYPHNGRATLTTTRANTTAPSPTSTRRSGSTPNTPTPTSAAAMRTKS